MSQRLNTPSAHQLLDMINALTVTSVDCNIEERWRDTLAQIFDQAQLTTLGGTLNQVRTNPAFSELYVPSFSADQHYVLQQSGNTPFTSDDVHFIDSLLTLARNYCSIQDAVERGAAVERRRIARDLHDDVAARMLTLIHKLREQDEIDLARSLLKSMRNVIYTLDTKTNTLMYHALADIRAELQERLNTLGMQLYWSQPGTLDQLTFTPRQHINLNRMLHEITTNVIRHANAHFISITIDLEADQLHILACDDGSGFDIAACVPGKGINNIRTRVDELHGEVRWQIRQGCCIDIRFPVSLSAPRSE